MTSNANKPGRIESLKFAIRTSAKFVWLAILFVIGVVGVIELMDRVNYIASLAFGALMLPVINTYIQYVETRGWK